MAETNQIKPRVVVVVGTKESDKDKLAAYLVQEYGVLAVELGAFARELEQEADEDEPHLRYDASAQRLAGYGSEHVMQQLIAEIMAREQGAPEALVITDVRTAAEVAALKANFGSDLLLVTVKASDQKAWYDGIQKRDFRSNRENFQDPVEQDELLKSEDEPAETGDLVDIILWNESSRQAYYQQIETDIVPYLFPQRQ